MRVWGHALCLRHLTGKQAAFWDNSGHPPIPPTSGHPATAHNRRRKLPSAIVVDAVVLRAARDTVRVHRHDSVHTAAHSHPAIGAEIDRHNSHRCWGRTTI